jgi:hypothetical protein
MENGYNPSAEIVAFNKMPRETYTFGQVDEDLGDEGDIVVTRKRRGHAAENRTVRVDKTELQQIVNASEFGKSLALCGLFHEAA